MLFNNVKSFFNSSVRFLIISALATLLFISNVLPVAAATSRPNEGEANLGEIQRKTDELSQSSPLNLKEVQKATEEGGLNEAQGSADKEKMISPEEASSSDVEENVKGFFSKIKNSK